jgi:hypothetical protein
MTSASGLDEIEVLHEAAQAKLREKSAELGRELEQAIGQNPALTPLGASGKCYTIMNSDMFLKTKDGGSDMVLSAATHNWESQSKLLRVAMETLDPMKIRKYMQEAVDKESLPKWKILRDEYGNSLYDGSYTLRLHPTVCQIVRELLLD